MVYVDLNVGTYMRLNSPSFVSSVLLDLIKGICCDMPRDWFLLSSLVLDESSTQMSFISFSGYRRDVFFQQTSKVSHKSRI